MYIKSLLHKVKHYLNKTGHHRNSPSHDVLSLGKHFFLFSVEYLMQRSLWAETAQKHKTESEQSLIHPFIHKGPGKMLNASLTAAHWPGSRPLFPPHCMSSPSYFWKVCSACLTAPAVRSSRPESCHGHFGWRWMSFCSQSWWPQTVFPWSWAQPGGCGNCQRTRRGWGWQHCWSRRKQWRLGGRFLQHRSLICCLAKHQPPEEGDTRKLGKL